MRRYVVGGLLVALLLAFSGADLSPAVAQDKKDAKKDKGSKEKVGRVVVGEGNDGKFRLSIYDGDGKFLALSAPFASEKDARAAIDLIKEALAKPKIEVKKPEKKDKAEKKDK